MRKFLEVLIDENGVMSLHTDFSFYDSVEHPAPSESAAIKQAEKINRMLIQGMIPAMWAKRETQADKAIRFLALAMTIATAEPYDFAEQLWSTLMFEYIPHYEGLADKLKIPFGYDPSRIVRPLTAGGASAMKVGENLYSCSFPIGNPAPGGMPFPFPGFGGKGFGSGMN